MRYIRSLITIVLLLTLAFLQPSFAQENASDEYTVKLVYFYPKDKQPQENINAKTDKVIKRVQKFFADQMENHGYGRKTFKFATDANGNAVVHHIVGGKNADHYRKDVSRCLGEAARGIQTRNTILLVFIDHVGFGGGVAYSGRRAIVPAAPFWGTVGHELGHTFTLPHDFRGGRYIMSYNPPDMLSKCAAQWLDLNPYFNGGKVSAIENRVKIERLPTITYPPGNKHLYFKLTDPDGLYHLRFLHLHTMMHSCRTLSGKEAIVTLDTATISGKDRVMIQTVDRNGNARYAGWKNFGDIEPEMVLDISPKAIDVNDGLMGYWTFDEAGGKFTFDGSGNSRYARLSGGVALAFNEGKIGGALKNDGSRQNATVVDSAELINGLSAFSLCLWVKSNDTGTDRGFINGRTPNDKDDIFGFRYDKDGWGGGQRNVIKAGITTTDGTHILESSGNVQTTEWQHLAFTWRSGEPMKLYINGTRDTPSFIQPAISGTLSNVDKLVIGRGGKDRSRGWNGLIDDVRLYNRVLSAKEISALAFIKKSRDVSHGVSLTGMCNVTSETINAEANIKYILTVTNTGNVQDTIKLAISEGADAALSPTSVSLAPGVSSKVALTVPRFVRKTAGDYATKVVATSEGDSTKTAQIKTTTSIREPLEK
jgi:hypothetical protein